MTTTDDMTELRNNIATIVWETQDVDAIMTEIQAALAAQDVKSRIDELSTVQLVHGRYVTQAFVAGKFVTIQERITDLKTTQLLRNDQEAA